MSCPEPDVWFALPGAPSAELEAHLDRCAVCRELAAEVARLGLAGEPGASMVGAEPLVPELIPPGMQLGRYVVRGALGAGGMGVVLEAHDPQLDRVVALKVVRGLADSTAWGRRARARILDEARAMARIAHPNVVAIYELVELGGNQLIAMEHVDGPDLGGWLRSATPWRERLRVALEAGRGIAAAHAAGIIHGDIKPANILIGADGRARVTDFGLSALDSTVAARGTPGYAAPELAITGRADARCDQYSYAVTVWPLLLAGAPGAEVAGEPPVARVLRRALAHDPEARYATMPRLLDAMRAAVRPRARIGIAVALVAALALAAGTITWLAVPHTGSAGASAQEDGALANLRGIAALADDDAARAEAQFRHAVASAEAAGAGNELQLANALHNLGRALDAQGRTEDAVGAHTRAVDVVERAHGREHVGLAAPRLALAELALRAGKRDEAAAQLEGALGAWDRAGTRDERSLQARFLLARVRWDQSDREAARGLAEDARAGLVAIDSPSVAAVTAWLDARRR